MYKLPCKILDPLVHWKYSLKCPLFHQNIQRISKIYKQKTFPYVFFILTLKIAFLGKIAFGTPLMSTLRESLVTGSAPQNSLCAWAPDSSSPTIIIKLTSWGWDVPSSGPACPARPATSTSIYYNAEAYYCWLLTMLECKLSSLPAELLLFWGGEKFKIKAKLSPSEAWAELDNYRYVSIN